MAETTQQEFNIRDYWQLLVRRRWLIYTLTLITTVAAAVSSFVATPTYKATCSISIERSGVRLLKQDLASAEPSWLDYQNFYNTQYKIIESDRVLRMAVERLKLKTLGIPGEKSSSYNPLATLTEWKQQIFGSVFGSKEIAEDETYKYVRTLRGGLSVDPVRDSHLVQISFVSADREFSARAANEIARAYIDFTLDAKLEIARQSSEFFLKRIAEMQKEIKAEEESIQRFAREHQLVTGDTNEAALKNFEDLRQRLTKTQAELGEARGKYMAYSQASGDSLEEVRRSPLIEQLSQLSAEADAEYKQKLATYGSEYPEVLKARSVAEAKHEKLKAETATMARQIIEASRVDYLSKQSQVAELQRLFDNSRVSVDNFQGPYAEYLTQKKVIDAKRTTLNEMLDKQNQMTLNATLGETGHNVRVIDDAQTPRMKFKPKTRLNVMIGFLFGLFLGVGGAVLMEYIDNTLKTPDDIRNVLGLAVLGMIPAQDSSVREATERRRRREKPPRERISAAAQAGEAPRSANVKDLDPALITLQSPLSPTAEAYRELRTAILLATPGHPPRDLTVTSCQPGEGKTTTAVNLAIALAQLGRRVLIVDTDLRRPRCHQVLNASAARGVSTYLTGNSDLGPLIQETVAERVWLLPGGPIPPNPAELLDADRFRELVARLRASEEFDHVIFDSPPVLSVVDPLLIGRYTEGTVMVIKSAFTSRESGRLGKEKLLSGRVNLLGVLLNAVSTEHVPYQYRYYRYGYSRQEGEEGHDRDESSSKKRGAGVGGSKSA